MPPEEAQSSFVDEGRRREMTVDPHNEELVREQRAKAVLEHLPPDEQGTPLLAGWPEPDRRPVDLIGIGDYRQM